jgi:hypothetical protein
MELTAGAGVAVALGIAGLATAREIGAGWHREAHAARAAYGADTGPGWSPIPAALEDAGELQPATGRFTIFEGVEDELLLAPLRVGRIARVKMNQGGSSVSLRIDFDNGARAAFKPEQNNWQQPRKELAAYRINRLLGLSSVAPAVGREFHIDEIIAALDPESAFALPRIRTEVVVDPEGYVVGELSWWIPVIGHARVDKLRIDEAEGTARWKQYLTVGEAIPRPAWLMVAQISDLVLFDFLINNADRWSGGNARSSADGKALYFMDNTLAFAPQPAAHLTARTYFKSAQKFSRSLVAGLRALSEARLRDALEADTGPFEALLTDEEIAAVMARREAALAYIDALVELHGAEAVLVFP